MLYMTPRIQHKLIDGVENKRCCSCKLYSPLSNYNKSSQSWDKLRPTCKTCLTKERKDNIEKIREYNVKYWENTKDSQKEKCKIWRDHNKDYIKEKNIQYRKENAKEMDKKRWQVVKKRLEEDKEFKEEKAKQRREAEKVKRKTDPEWKLKQNVSRRIRELLQTKSKSSVKYLGCTIPELRTHLEKQFNEQMNLENQGLYWHIDHIIPCAAFDLSNEFEINACFNYRNLQPLEAKENIFKKDKFNVQDKVEYLKNF